MIDTISSSKVVIDNTTLSNFSLAGNFNLLNDILQGAKIITLSVKTESFIKDQVRQDVSLAIESGWIEVQELNGIQMLSEYYTISKKYPTISPGIPKLGDGEAASIIYAKYKNCILITDDNGPKKLAKRYGITTVGSIGLIYIAREKRLINFDYCDELFQQMKSNGAFFPNRYLSFSDCIPDLKQKFTTVENHY